MAGTVNDAKTAAVARDWLRYQRRHEQQAHDRLRTGNRPPDRNDHPRRQPPGRRPDDTTTIYYTAGENAASRSCGNQQQWANLPCERRPAAQPKGAGPALPTTTIAYNMWDEPTEVLETFANAKRTSKSTYDEAGRLTTASITSTTGQALATVKDRYDSASGLLTATEEEGGSRYTERAYNALGQLEPSEFHDDPDILTVTPATTHSWGHSLGHGRRYNLKRHRRAVAFGVARGHA